MDSPGLLSAVLGRAVFPAAPVEVWPATPPSTGRCGRCAASATWAARRFHGLRTDAGRLALRRLIGSTTSAGLVELCPTHAGDYVVAGGVVDPIEAVTTVEERDALDLVSIRKPARGVS